MNYTAASGVVGKSFSDEGDIARSSSLVQIATVLEKGTKVALVYGDRDFACNWVGGEVNSLLVDYVGSKNFSSAGYTPIFTESNSVGGQVRQYGNYSFSRVYQSGHLGIYNFHPWRVTLT